MKFPKIKYTYYVVFQRAGADHYVTGMSTRIINTDYKVCNAESINKFAFEVINQNNTDNTAIACESVLIINFILLNCSIVW